MTGFEKVGENIKGRRGGKRPGAGRKRGIPNKITTDLREMIRGALEAVGGQAYLERIAKEHPQVFCALVARALPLQHSGEIAATLRLERTIDRPPDETREQWLARRSRELGRGTADGRAN